ncbi:DUF3515 domain-containing protein [Brevibacterium sp. 50QC2O2]|jgi:hypothetical protein|uniref:DUF3515 domain-containing protein n=1 Tax=Brevibacterium TaxID=1696 RepID=UPI00211C2C85|nr:MULTISPECIES: DUF3515 domain-containing protein [unclassified Brevibacterium]MCQ9367802.1 DUF3515 domain-containing protein [Brevibacterium sp. 91QC2O2]MCQ9384892.1 DUF3515 domain-containing protein [Brevibacterium sp. 68QC2CO]MCQ9388061.1 DUF3515 domain-containing protein [Brevibacterium sp. 50QC2O2]
MRRYTGWTLAAASVGLGLVLSGCTDTLVVESAPHPEDPACANTMLSLPDVVGDFHRRDTSSQATGAWGDPSAAVFKCGMDVPAPTTDPCVSVSGVDWISTQQDEKTWRFVTYNRKPAAEVLVDPTRMPGATALAALADAVGKLPESARSCVAAKDLDESGTPQVSGTATPPATRP